MKYLVSILFFAFMGNVFAQGVKGNQEVIKKTFNVSNDYEKISVSGSFEVYIKEGNNSGKITVEADSNLMEHIKIKVKDNKLYIGKKTGKYFKKYKKLNVYVTAKNLKALALSGSGGITQKGINRVKEFKVAMSGSGDITTKAKASLVKLALSGSGDIEIEGTTKETKVAVSGSGDVEAAGLKSEKTNVAISGSADVAVHASKSIKVAISGSGDVVVHGNPKKVDSKTSGSGDVEII